jgi:hypothetical protein
VRTCAPFGLRRIKCPTTSSSNLRASDHVNRWASFCRATIGLEDSTTATTHFCDFYLFSISSLLAYETYNKNRCLLSEAVRQLLVLWFVKWANSCECLLKNRCAPRPHDRITHTVCFSQSVGPVGPLTVISLTLTRMVTPGCTHLPLERQRVPWPTRI